MEDTSEILSPKPQSRSIGRFFNKLLNKSFACKRQPKENSSYIDVSIMNQKQFLGKTLKKAFPSYQVTARHRSSPQKSRNLLVPEIKPIPKQFKIFSFKNEESLKRNKKNSVTLRKIHKPKTKSHGQTFGLLSLLRECIKDAKPQSAGKGDLPSNLTIQTFFSS